MLHVKKFESRSSPKKLLSIQIEFTVNLFEDHWHHNNTKDFNIFMNVVQQGIKCPQVKPVLKVCHVTHGKQGQISHISANKNYSRQLYF